MQECELVMNTDMQTATSSWGPKQPTINNLLFNLRSAFVLRIFRVL